MILYFLFNYFYNFNSRIFLYSSIILVIYHSFTKSLAVIMLVLEFYAILLHPCWMEFQTLRRLANRQGAKPALFLLAAVIIPTGIILFLPLSWGIVLPGEIVPEFRFPVSAAESGFLQNHLPHTPVKVRKNEILFILKNPQMKYAVKKLEAAAAYDRTLLQLQQLDEKDYNLVPVTRKKILSDQVALKELYRREKLLTVRSAADGIFVKHLPDLSPGINLPGNTNVGEIISEGQLIHAYANDRDIARIQIGMMAAVRCADTPDSFDAKVVSVDTVPGNLPPGPLLQPFGGSIPVYPDEKNFIPVQTLYRITLKPESPLPHFTGTSKIAQQGTGRKISRPLFPAPAAKRILSIARLQETISVEKRIKIRH